MLQEQTIPIDFGMGVDTKTDPKLVLPGKLLRLENAVFTKIKRVAKRNGYGVLNPTIAGIGSLTAPQMAENYQSELMVADQNLLLSYSPSQTAWINKGPYTSIEPIKNSIDQEHPASGYTDCAVFGNYALYAWSTARETSGANTVSAKIYACVIDLQTGTNLTGNTLIVSYSGTLSAYLKCVLMANSTLGLFFTNAASSAIILETVTFAGSGVVTFSAPSTVSTSYQQNNFDAVGTAAGASIAYQNTTGIAVSNIATNGSISGTVTITDTISEKTNTCILISRNSVNNNLWIYWTNETAATSDVLQYAIYTSALVLVLAKTTIVSTTDPDYISNVISITNSATQQTIYYGITPDFDASPLLGAPLFDYTRYGTVTSSGVVITALFTNGVSPYSKSFEITLNGTTAHYAFFIYRGLAEQIGNDLPLIQPTLFLIRLDILAVYTATVVPQVIARLAAGITYSEANSTLKISYSASIASISATKFIFPCGVYTQEFIGDFYTGVDAPPAFGLAGTFAYYLDFASQNIYQGANAGELLMLNGALIQCYDGNSCTEWNFHLFPEIVAAEDAKPMSGGLIESGNYSYIAIYQWTDFQGNLHQSTPSNAFAAVVADDESTITVYVTPTILTQKVGASIAIYRTEKDGTIYYLVTDPKFPLNSIDQTFSISAVSFVDNIPDADLIGNPQAYTYPGSSVLENTTPPPSMLLLPHNNRLFFNDAENPADHWYTKSFSPGNGLSPSGFLIQQIDQKFGPSQGLAEMDEKWVILKQSGVVVQSGDGANDTGTGSTFSFPQFIPSDVGCDNSKSVITQPEGVMFHTAKGLYILTRSLGVAYIGAEVQDYNAQVITSADLIPGKSQIRFLCSTGLTLVFDYIFKQWSTFTNHTGLSATNWNGSYVYSTGASIYQESAGVYTDNGVAFALLLQTSWLALASVQGFQRVKRLIMLGDYANGLSALHNLSISAAYDFSTTFQTAITYAYGAVSSSGVFQYRERLPRQKCDAISLLIQETTTGSSLEYVDLTNISFEAGIKKGVNKLGGLQSVG